MDRVGVLLVILVSTISKIECTDDPKALLDLKVIHPVDQEFRPGDEIQYSCVIKQREESVYEAVEIVVEILLPDTLGLSDPNADPQQNRTDTDQVTRVVHNKNSFDFIIPTLPLRSQVEFKFDAVINDDTLSAGLHYASTPIKLHYKTRISTNQITPFHDVLMVAQVAYLIAGCTQPLGISDGSIKYYQFSASSTQVDLKPDKIRMNGVDDAWCADVRDNKPYIQIFLNRRAKVSGVATWGRKEKELWVKKYTVEFSLDGSTWYAYSDTGIMKQFLANDDQHTKVMHWLSEPFEANYVRLFPIQWSVGVCMRIELYGCDLVKGDNCIKPLGMENGNIPLASITEKLPPSIGFPDSRNWSRLNSVNPEFPYGWMADISMPDYLQIDLGSAFQIKAIAIQAGYGSAPPYVTKFTVSYSMDNIIWNEKDANEDGDTEFPGSVGGILPDIVPFTPSFKARYVRIAPTDGNMVKSMRMELYGCLADDHTDVKKFTGIELWRRSILVDQVTGYIYVCIFTHDQGKSMCKRSKDGYHWRALHQNIMGVVYQARLSRRLYALDRQFHKAFSDNNGETWYTISEGEWKRQLRDLEVNSATNIEDILPTKIPDTRYTWTTQEGNKWGVSGNGLHMMDSRSVEWKMCAAWKCCGL